MPRLASFTPTRTSTPTATRFSTATRSVTAPFAWATSITSTLADGARRVSTVTDGIATGHRIYRLTPARLRRPEPALRAGLAAASVWAVAFFGGLAFVAAHRTIGPAVDPTRWWTTVAGYGAAACAGAVAIGCTVTRRYRGATWAIGTAVLVGHCVTLLTVA